MRKRKHSQSKSDVVIEEKKKSKVKNFQTLMNKFFDDFERWCGFRVCDLTTFERFIKLMYRPMDPASLGVVRALFGLCMVLDIVDERGLADIDLKWGDPYGCHFPLIHGMIPPSLPWMTLLFTLMWIGAFGIMLGFYFKLACAAFVIPYWYIFLLDKTFWNNHSYLYGVVASLLWLTDASAYFSLDSQSLNVGKHQKNKIKIPLWNYFIIKFQFFVLYFLAGVKKSSNEWLDGYAMTNLSHHWVFDPFKLFLTIEQTDLFIVHWFGFIFDLTIGFWMVFDKTRIPAMIICAAFHLMNSRLFSIGMFPWVCLATMPLFCRTNWPRKVFKKIRKIGREVKQFYNTYFYTTRSDKIPERLKKKLQSDLKNSERRENYQEIDHRKLRSDKNISKSKLEASKSGEMSESDQSSIVSGKKCKITAKDLRSSTKKEKFVVSLLLIHVLLQLFLPCSHFITKGYNNWVPGLYGYSWDMMVHTWDTILIVVRVHDNDKSEDHFVDPQAWVQNDKWSKHGDMVIQYAQCLNNNLLRCKDEVLQISSSPTESREWSQLSLNLSIYVDVRCSLNGRFQQRMFNPNVDLLTVDWHPLKPVSFLMPLLTQYNSYRNKMDEITRHVYTWSNYTDVLFIADYPGLQLENYFSEDFFNVSLTVIEGEVTYSEAGWADKMTIGKDQNVYVNTEKLHHITTTSAYPSCYMYTYTNRTREELERNGTPQPARQRSGFPIIKELKYKAKSWWRALSHITDAFYYLVYEVPMRRRIPRAPNYDDEYY